MKMYTNLKYLPIAAFAAVALSLAGCGGGDDDPVVSTPAMDDNGTATDGDGTTTPDPTAGPTDEQVAADVAAATKAAGTKEEAIGDEAGQTDDAGLGGTDAPDTTVAE